MNWQTILYILAAVAVVFAGIWFLIPAAIKKGINLTGILGSTSTVINTADAVIDGLKLLMPENTALQTIDLIISYAQKAVAAAEQMYKAAQIDADKRKDAAIDIVNTCLSIAGIERTADIDKVVSGMIEAAVLTLPKTNSK